MKNPATGTTVTGHLVTPTGPEGANSPVFITAATYAWVTEWMARRRPPMAALAILRS